MQEELPRERHELLIMALVAKLDQRLIGYITTLENLTKARVKDAFISDETVIFIVYQGDAGKAIGRRGESIRRLTYLLKRKIKIIELSTNVSDFIKSVIDPLKVDKIDVKENAIVLSVHDSSTKGKIIGRNGKNLKLLNDLVDKYFHTSVIVS